MKTGAIFCVLAVVCLFGTENAEGDREADKVIRRLSLELTDQAKAEWDKRGPLVDDASSKLKSAAADAINSGNNVQAQCLENARDMLRNAKAEFWSKMLECSRTILTDAQLWFSKRKVNTSRIHIELYVTGELLKASVCNKRQTRVLRRVVQKARPSANRHC